MSRSTNKTTLIVRKYPWVLLFAIIAVMIVTFLFYYFFVKWICLPFELVLGTDLGDEIAIYMAIIGFILALFISFTYQQAVGRQRVIQDSLYREAKGLYNIILFSKTFESAGSEETIKDVIKNYLNFLLEGGYSETENVCEEAFQRLFEILKELRKALLEVPEKR